MADRLEPFLNELRQWVEIETPTHEKRHVDRLGGIIRRAGEQAGLVTDIVPGAPGLGDTIRARSGPDNGEKPVLVPGRLVTDLPRYRRGPVSGMTRLGTAAHPFTSNSGSTGNCIAVTR